jgi:mRNA-degrading endonuclease toxin of MazEF toxin-antitoxin module
VLPAKTLMLAGRVAHTLRSGAALTLADRDEAAQLIEQLAEFVAELPEPERRKPSDTPEARRLRKERSRQLSRPGHAPEGVTSRDMGVTGRDEGRDRLLIGSGEVEADYEVIDESRGRDMGRDTHNAANSAAAAAPITTNYLTTRTNRELDTTSTNLNKQEQLDSHTSLALVRQSRTPAKPPARSVAEITESIATLMASVQAGTETRLANEKLLRWKAEVAFAYWAKRMGHERSLLDAGRERRLIARLRENNGDLNELLYCVDGAQRDDWIMGRDAKSPRKYDGDETIFRDRAQVERLARLCPAYVRGEPHPMAKKYAALMGEGPAPETGDTSHAHTGT